LRFFTPVKKIITVTAEKKTKKYGEKLPVFTSTILVDSIPLDQTTFTMHQLGLDSILYTTPATSFSNTGIYFIAPSMRILNLKDSFDISLTEKFN
jgi:hypothetical protein